MAPSSYGIREFAYAFGLVSSNGAEHTRQPALLGVEILVACLQAIVFTRELLRIIACKQAPTLANPCFSLKLTLWTQQTLLPYPGAGAHFFEDGPCQLRFWSYGVRFSS